MFLCLVDEETFYYVLLRFRFEVISVIGYTQLKFARGKGADCGRHGRYRANRGWLGRGRKFWPVIGADREPVGFNRYFGGVTRLFCGGPGRGRMSLASCGR